MDNYNNFENNSENMSFVITIIITITIGIIIGSVIGYILFKNIKYIGPDSNKIVKKIYYDSDGKKYKLIPKICVCPMNYSMRLLHNPTFKESH
jgi:ABC-type lipoprotein release transport system permease subunit